MRAIGADEPLMVAWVAYAATDDFANTRRWAAQPEHLEGSLWAAFMQGFLAAQGMLLREAGTAEAVGQQPDGEADAPKGTQP